MQIYSILIYIFKEEEKKNLQIRADDIRPLLSLQSLDDSVLDFACNAGTLINQRSVALNKVCTSFSKFQCVLAIGNATTANDCDIFAELLSQETQGLERVGFDGST